LLCYSINTTDESLLCDQRIIAAAAKNSGGVVLAQVKRICATGSLPSRSVGVPGAMVDCVCVVDESEHDIYHPMSYTKRNDPVLYGIIRSPAEDVPQMPLNERKIIARRASFGLKPGKVVNLGIGLPEGIASVAGEEGQLQYITLTTEPGVFGGLPASGHEFGPASNADAVVEMNEMFDFYDGGGLDMCFLGAAQISPQGDVNVSRMSADKLIGPGGFIDISQSTRNISFLCTFTAKGLDIDFDGDEGKITIVKDGKIKKFVNQVYERTFSGEEAVRRGQKVYYVTERAVFRRTASNDVIELIEIAPGVDLQKDILDQMEFKPVVSPKLKQMDKRVFRHERMEIELFGSLKDRVTYHEGDHVIFIDLTGISLASQDEVRWLGWSLDLILQPITKERGPVDVIVNYDGFDCKSGLEQACADEIEALNSRHYKSVKRYSFNAFRRAKLKNMARVEAWNATSLFREWNEDNSGTLSPLQLRTGVRETFGIRLKQAELDALCKEGVTLHNFTDILLEVMSKFE
jgi:propionate CoA-transferase